MNKIQKNSSGFAIVETLLIVIIVGILGSTGWFVYHAQKSADKLLTSNNSSTPVFKKKSKVTNTAATASPATPATPVSTPARNIPVVPATPTATVVTSANGKVQITLPAGTKVDRRVDGGGDCGFAAGVPVHGTCITQVSFAPGSMGYVMMYQTTDTALNWYDSAFGACSSPQNSTVKGNTELICTNHLSNSQVYTISNGSYLAYFAGNNSSSFLSIINSTTFL